MPTKKSGKTKSSKGKSGTTLKSTLKRDVTASSKATGKVDLEDLRKRNPPLAEILDEFVMGKTARDDPTPVIKDLTRVIDARDPKSRLGSALSKLEKQLSATKKSSKKSNK